MDRRRRSPGKPQRHRIVALTAAIVIASGLPGAAFSEAPAATPPAQAETAELPGNRAAEPLDFFKFFRDDRLPQIVVVQPAPSAKSWVDWVEKLIQFVALLMGGLWVWANYLLNRTHRARLEARVSAEVVPLQGGLVKLVLGLKNVGLSKVDLLNEGTAVRMYSLDPGNPSQAPWRHRNTVAIWESVDWVEPGESCEEQHMLRIPLAQKYPIKFEVFVICHYKSFPLRRSVSQTLRGSYVLPPLIRSPEVPT